MVTMPLKLSLVEGGMDDLDCRIASLHSSPILGRSRVGCLLGLEERLVVAHSIPFHWYTCTTGINIYQESPHGVPELPVKKRFDK